MNISSVNYSPAFYPLNQVRYDNSNPGLTITPNEGNVKTGDRSQNSFDVSIKTDKISAEFSFTREQAIDSVIRRNTPDYTDFLNTTNNNLLTVKVALNKGIVTEDQVLSLATTRYNQQQVSTYLSIYSDSQIYGQPTNNYPYSEGTSGYQLYLDASQKEVRRTLFFAAAENGVIDIKV